MLGAVLALLIGFLLWLEKAPRELAGAARALQRHADYVLALVREKSGEAAESPRRIVELRRQACLAADNAQASLERLQQNPLHRDSKVDTAEALLNAMRRVTAAGTVLEIQPGLPADSEAASAARLRRNPAQALHPRDGEPEPGGRVMPVPAVGLAQPGLPPLWNASPARRGRSSSCATSSNRPRACAGRGKLRPA